MTTDLIANMLTNIRNANKILNTYTFCKYTKININILNILIDEGYILNYKILENIKKSLIIKIFLKYKGWWIKKPVFSLIKKISKLSNRIYCKYKNLKKNIYMLNYNKGIAILSTSSGLLTQHKATKLKKGGELICYIE